MKLRCDSDKEKIQILKFLTTVIENYEEKYTPIISDALPFISELLDDSNNEVKFNN